MNKFIYCFISLAIIQTQLTFPCSTPEKKPSFDEPEYAPIVYRMLLEKYPNHKSLLEQTFEQKWGEYLSQNGCSTMEEMKRCHAANTILLWYNQAHSEAIRCLRHKQLQEQAAAGRAFLQQ